MFLKKKTNNNYIDGPFWFYSLSFCKQKFIYNSCGLSTNRRHLWTIIYIYITISIYNKNGPYNCLFFSTLIRLRLDFLDLTKKGMFAFKNQLSKITSKKLKIEELEGLKKT